MEKNKYLLNSPWYIGKHSLLQSEKNEQELSLDTEKTNLLKNEQIDYEETIVSINKEVLLDTEETTLFESVNNNLSTTDINDEEARVEENEDHSLPLYTTRGIKLF